MHRLRESYGVGEAFFDRYFLRNAENSFVIALKRFMLWREGSFPNPRRKDELVRQFLEAELKDYYERGIFRLPQLGFSLTTRCTLRCRHCIALSQLFEHKGHFSHFTLTFADFRRQLDAILAGVDGIRSLYLHGGEPLLNPEVAEICAYAAAQEKIQLVELITNGSVPLSEPLLATLKQYADRIFLAVNDYSVNPALAGRLHKAEIVAQLDAHGIKRPLYTELSWLAQEPMRGQGRTPDENRQFLERCWCRHSLQILAGRLAICPKASMAELLKCVPPVPDDYLAIAEMAKNPRQALQEFYERDLFAVCGYCAPQTRIIPPAEQCVDIKDALLSVE